MYEGNCKTFGEKSWKSKKFLVPFKDTKTGNFERCTIGVFYVKKEGTSLGVTIHKGSSWPYIKLLANKWELIFLIKIK